MISMKLQRNMKYVLLGALVIVLFLMPIGVLADTGTIYNDEIYVSYVDDKCALRYWYKNSDVKHTLVLNSIQEFSESNVQTGVLYFEEAKVNTYELSTSSQKLVYDLDDFQGETDLRHHVKVEIELEFNYIEIGITVIRWDIQTIGNPLVLTYTHNGVLNEVQLESTYYFKRITVLPTSDSWNNNLEIFLGISNSVFLLILTVLSILNLSILLLHRRH